MASPETVKQLVDDVLPQVTEIRHAIHRRPELALEEVETAALVRNTLRPLGMQFQGPFLGTDVVAVMEGRGPGRHVVLRADMDALPLQEKTGVPHQSEKDGLMHACGHDGHTAALLGAALVLSRLREQFDGSVKFVFQPGEEVVAAGKDLVEKGALLEPRPDTVMAIHAWSGLPAGAIVSKPGALLAAAGFFRITIKGKGAHGSKPEASIDPILTGARVVEALQTIVSRNVSALAPAVVSICRFTGGTNGNIIPDAVELEGTTRCLDVDTGNVIRTSLERIVRGVCDSMGATCELEWSPSYVPTVNDEAVVAMAREVTRKVLGESLWVEKQEPSMGGEDFAFYIQDYPGAMFFIGMGEDSAPLHNPGFDYNDAALGNAVLFFVAATLEALARTA